jgi:SAM-dependent methyltransferase
VNEADPVDLLFGGMEKLGPGDNAHTLRILDLLPAQRFERIVDAGCGTGRQTLALARRLGTRIHAVDTHKPFLDDLLRRARDAQLEHLVQAHCLDMKQIPEVFREIDLLWSEGAAYNIGFSDALALWRSALSVRGLVVVSELSWLKASAPDDVVEFLQAAYPAMQTVGENQTAASSELVTSGSPLTRFQAWPGSKATTTCSGRALEPCSNTRPLRFGSSPPKRCGRSRSSSARRTATGTCSTCYVEPRVASGPGPRGSRP